MAWGVARRARKQRRTFRAQLELEVRELSHRMELAAVAAAARQAISDGELSLAERCVELQEQLRS
jgi:hypothetical protein